MNRQPRWMPGQYTKPLSEDFVSDGPALRKLWQLVNPDITLDAWQCWLIDAVLERYPDWWPVHKLRGRLRYRQVVISLARQNGKSEIGAVFGIYGLVMHITNGIPIVVGVAQDKDAADNIFARVKKVIDENPALARRFKTTRTRGIVSRTGASQYMVKPAKDAALQGIPITLCLYDEIHLTPPPMWAAVVMGTTAIPDGLVLGITTAGDDSSLLLKDLYDQGKKAVEDPDTRFGFFLWEAPEGCAVDDPEALLDANPALAEGRLDLDTVIQQIQMMPEDLARRYRLNQFQRGGLKSWLPMRYWHAAASDRLSPADLKDVVFSVDRTPVWDYATISVTGRYEDKIHTQVIASIVNPNRQQLMDICLKLRKKYKPLGFVMEGYNQLKDFADDLRDKGATVYALRSDEVASACATAYALIASGKITHASDPLMYQQMPHAVKKNSGDSWRINRAASTDNIDAVMATVFGIYIAETKKKKPLVMAVR